MGSYYCYRRCKSDGNSHRRIFSESGVSLFGTPTTGIPNCRDDSSMTVILFLVTLMLAMKYSGTGTLNLI